jgi:hypothetical protein
MAAVNETCTARMIKHAKHRVPKAIDVGEHHRLAVLAELVPRHDLNNLFHGANTARQDHESVRALKHLVLALVHGLDDRYIVELGHCGLGRFPIDKKPWNDRTDLAASAQCSMSDGTHQAGGAAAIDQPHSSGRQGRSQPLACLDIKASLPEEDPQ